jgi:hypothetical protein
MRLVNYEGMEEGNATNTVAAVVFLKLEQGL